MKTRNAFSGLILGLLVMAAAAGLGLPQTASAQTGAMRPGFDATAYGGNDDGTYPCTSSSQGVPAGCTPEIVPLGFTANFFNLPYSGLYINNNGNVTFDSALGTFTPFDLTSTGRIIIAPFFADVDTRAGNVVTYGTGTVGDHPAFGVNWPGVGCFAAGTNAALNFFQVVLIDRSLDFAPGDFDIEFNYDHIQWETGTASSGDANCLGGNAVRVGYSNGTGAAGTFFELPGSAIPGSFLDTNTVTGLIFNSRNNAQPGRYVFEVRSGIVVDVNDAPTDIALDNSSVAENAGANAAVGNLSTTDPDAGDTFTYTLVSGAGDTGNGSFNISGSTLQATASLDFEATPSLSVLVRSTDAGGLFTDKQFTITVNNANETPTNIALSNSSVAENAGANAPVGNLSTTDPDAGDTFTYTLVSGTGDTGNASFNILGASLRATAFLDFEATPSLSVRVRSTDAGGLFTDKQFTITVSNVNEAPTDIALDNSSVDENQPSGTTVGSFSTTDPDVGDTFTYTLVPGPGSTDNASFSILGGVLKTAAVFNYEVKNSYNIRVRSTDALGAWTEKPFTIGVNNVAEAIVSTAATGLNFPMGVAVGSVYIADRNNHRVVKIGASPTDLIVVAGTGEAGYNGDGIAATTAQLNSPTGVVLDGSGNLFIADSQNHIIRKVVLSTGLISTVAGTPTKFGVAVNGGPATNPSCGAAPAPACPTLFNPRGVAVDGAGNIYIADTMNQQIRKVDVGTGNILAVAGVAGVTGSNDGPVATARLNSPLGVAVDAFGVFYIADEGNDMIRRVFVGEGGPEVETVNTGSLEAPAGVAVDAAGTLYIADTNNHRVQRVSGGTVDTVAGTGTAGSGAGELNTPVAVAVSADGCVLYVADLINQRIQKVDFCGPAT